MALKTVKMVVFMERLLKSNQIKGILERHNIKDQIRIKCNSNKKVVYFKIKSIRQQK